MKSGAPRSDGFAAPSEGRVYLHPGQLAASADDCTLSTVLGSCVGVCLHDPVAQVGGLNHFLLPLAPAGSASSRYGDVATRMLIAAVRKLGGRPERMTAAVVGGACVIDVYKGRVATLGTANAGIAVTVLAEAGIRITFQETLGHRGRRLTFSTRGGDVRVRML